MFINTFASGEIASGKFNSVLNKFKTNDNLKFEEPVYRDDLSKFIEYAKSNIAKHASCNRSNILIRFRRDIA